MSVESFFSTYQVGKELKGRIIKEKLPNMSPVATFATILARNAGDGLREITKKLGDSGVAFRLDQESFQRLSPKDRQTTLVNQAGVIFGISLVVLEDSLINGSFDLEHWCSLYNNAISGTPLPKMEVEQDKTIEVITPNNLREMRKLANQDKTFVSFFGEDVKFVPESLKSIFSNDGILSIIRRYILPSYKERANLLTAPS